MNEGVGVGRRVTSTTVVCVGTVLRVERHGQNVLRVERYGLVRNVLAKALSHRVFSDHHFIEILSWHQHKQINTVEPQHVNVPHGTNQHSSIRKTQTIIGNQHVNKPTGEHSQQITTNLATGVSL